MSGMTLKRGRGLSFCGTNWKLTGEDKWDEHPVYVPNGNEKHVGTRTLMGVSHEVFLCLDDGFLAQPTSVCALPMPDDPSAILSDGPGKEPVPERPAKASPSDVKPKSIMSFSGKNWKLAADNKWAESTAFTQDGVPIGSKTIKGVECDVYKIPGGFMAVRR